MDYAIWMSQKETELTMSNSDILKEEEKKMLLLQANEIYEIALSCLTQSIKINVEIVFPRDYERD